MIGNFYGNIVRRPENYSVVTFGRPGHLFSTIRAEVHVISSKDSEPTLCANKKLQSELEKILEIEEEDNCTVFPMNEKPMYCKTEKVKVEFGYSKSILFSKNIKEGRQLIGISKYDPGIIYNVVWQGVLYKEIKGLKYS